MWIQTVALFVDAYRELNARKLFWATLILSAVVVATFAFIGITEKGVRIGVWDFELFGLTTEIMSPEEFYKSMFVNFGIGFWLAWIATIMALVSTASIFPDFVSSGAIDLALSKPIGRLRLFLTKYLSGLLFVTLQVTVFSGAAFLLIGIMGGAWEPALFLSIPIIVLFFSYLYCICVLLGILTRSTIAALMLTLLVWFAIFLVHSAESSLLTFKFLFGQQQEAQSYQLEQRQKSLSALESEEVPDQEKIEQMTAGIDQLEKQQESNQLTLGRLETAHRISMLVKTVLPKTNETVGLLRRWLIQLAELPEQEATPPEDPFSSGRNVALEREIEEQLRERSVAWIGGTSLLFELAVLGLAAWIFVRRDY
jgi:ABC-type transport system involved in multi-copper enzyme maturation permease subunit